MGTIKAYNVNKCREYFNNAYEVKNIIDEYDKLRQNLKNAEDEKNSADKSGNNMKAKESNYKKALSDYKKGYERLKKCIEKNITDNTRRKQMVEKF